MVEGRLHSLFLQSDFYLPQVPSESNNLTFHALLSNLTTLTEHVERISALLTLTKGQDDDGLVALQAIFDQLMNNTCRLVSLFDKVLISKLTATLPVY